MLLGFFKPIVLLKRTKRPTSKEVYGQSQKADEALGGWREEIFILKGGQ